MSGVALSELISVLNPDSVKWSPGVLVVFLWGAIFLG